jgi:hypothetical protein
MNFFKYHQFHTSSSLRLVFDSGPLPLGDASGGNGEAGFEDEGMGCMILDEGTSIPPSNSSSLSSSSRDVLEA